MTKLLFILLLVSAQGRAQEHYSFDPQGNSLLPFFSDDIQRPWWTYNEDTRTLSYGDTVVAMVVKGDFVSMQRRDLWKKYLQLCQWHKIKFKLDNSIKL